jgi:hypothetical protein
MSFKGLSGIHLKVPMHTAYCQMAWTRTRNCTFEGGIVLHSSLVELSPGLSDVMWHRLVMSEVIEFGGKILAQSPLQP